MCMIICKIVKRIIMEMSFIPEQKSVYRNLLHYSGKKVLGSRVNISKNQVSMSMKSGNEDLVLNVYP